ncbi:3-hydroxyacyl-CoA dehydrogenase NAD-binding domain-containing protein [Streptomyces sp. NP160]|uniref:3-hydroxyacyl-CoA dehydrogenase NAD-binding domain-containing protein n=1 Tax=Streptomyces sp. NP160 TaxID=2586637 RepID=UPI0035A5A741
MSEQTVQAQPEQARLDQGTGGTEGVVRPEDLVDPNGSERVTLFPWQEVPLAALRPGLAGSIALITMDNSPRDPEDHRRPTTLGPAGLLQLRDTLDAVEARVREGAVTAVAITGKPFVFAVGADLKDVARISSTAAARAVAQHGHDQLRRLGELGVPSFAFVNGPAMGGGLEVALHCTYRTASSVARGLALPEVALGLVPGWGGTHLLPALIGIEKAVRVVIADPASQKTLTAQQALELGVVDVVLDSPDFLEESLRWAARVVDGDVVVDRPEVSRDERLWDGVLAATRTGVDKKLHGAAPAPYRALDLLARARTDVGEQGREAAFAAEDDALAELIMTDEFRSGVYSFDLVQRRAKKPAGAPDPKLARPVGKVGVVGAGLMASQLALVFARQLKVPVVLTDLDQARVDKGVAWVHGEIAKLREKGRLSDGAAQRLTAGVTGTTSTAEAFGDADLVIEAVFEELSVKQQVFREVERVVREDCVLMTNTSSLSVTAMARALEHPERLVGFHFFNPVAVMPLVEVVRTTGETPTDDVTLATAFAVGKGLRKSCVLVQDAPAFVVNRLLTRFMSEASVVVDEGTPVEVAEAALDSLGLPMSNFELLGLVGPAVALHVAESLHAAFPERFPVSANLRRIVEAGLPGVYEKGSRTLTDAARGVLVLGDSPSTEEQVRERVLAALADEARRMLDEGVVSDPRDIDLCLQLGAGWPAHLGGILPLLDRTGVSERVTGQRFLPRGVASVPA